MEERTSTSKGHLRSKCFHIKTDYQQTREGFTITTFPIPPSTRVQIHGSEAEMRGQCRLERPTHLCPRRLSIRHRQSQVIGQGPAPIQMLHTVNIEPEVGDKRRVIVPMSGRPASTFLPHHLSQLTISRQPQYKMKPCTINTGPRSGSPLHLQHHPLTTANEVAEPQKDEHTERPCYP